MALVLLIVLAEAARISAPPASPETAGAGAALLIAPKVGLFKSTSALGPAFFAGLELGCALPVLDGKLAVSLELDVASSSTDGNVDDPQLTTPSGTADGSYDLDERQLGLVLAAIYRGQLTPTLAVYGGLGPGVYFHKSTERAFGTRNDETEGSFGLRILGGVELQAGPGGAFFETHYHFTQVGFLTTGDANVGGFLAAAVGYRLRFDL